MQKKVKEIWRKRPVNREAVRALEKHGASGLVAKVLVGRGIDTPEKMDKFLRKSIHDLQNPFSAFPDMKKAAERIARAVLKGEKIAVYGDADADGISSASVIYNMLKKVVPDDRIMVSVPSRDKEGYGLTLEYVEDVAKKGAKVIITADCGIKNFEEIRYARELGIDVIVCDHHKRENSLPQAYAILHTSLSTREEVKHLSGVGVAFELMTATYSILRRKFPDLERPRRFLDVVTIGTIGDMVPLIGDNRIFISEGLKLIRSGDGNEGLKALFDIMNFDVLKVSAEDIQMKVVPRINSAGRLGEPELSFKLLSEKGNVLELARLVESANEERKEITKSIIDEIESWGFDERADGIVLWGDDWPEGIIGLVASQILSKTGKPTCVISRRKDIARGSVRSPEWLDIMGVLKSIPYLKKFGGHSQAAGIVLEPEDVPRFEHDFVKAVQKFSNNIKEYIRFYDDELLFDELRISEIKKLLELEPFGEGNPNPLFLANCYIRKSRKVGRNKEHLKLYAETKDGIVEIVAFGKADLDYIVGRRKLILKFKSSYWSAHGFDFELVDIVE